jgi:hypothetical protein
VTWPRFFQRVVHESTVIDAPPERVWAVLTDIAAYREWNAFMPWMEGDLVTGGTVRAAVVPDRGPGFRFRASIVRCDDCRELTWRGAFLAPFVFHGVHTFRLEQDGGGGTRFTQHEVMQGLLAPVLGPFLSPRMDRGFRAMNLGLARRVGEVR